MSEPKPEVGMGCTESSGSDRYAGTIVEVSPTGAWIKFTLDKSTRTDKNGFSEDQTWVHETDRDATPIKATRRQDGAYRVVRGRSRVTIGKRSTYRDPSF